uniref:Uncharacterized protein n=1 Tax=Anguilla anguilla TaxID=7936 RepID=A0A0E9QEP6_ANGAN
MVLRCYTDELDARLKSMPFLLDILY